jgi:hypothetical protein
LTIPTSLPVLFFGNLFHAQIATIGLNPSWQELLSPARQELTGSARRFQSLTSLGSCDRASLTPEQCARAIAAMRDYFLPGKPVYHWFCHLKRLIDGLGCHYTAGEVVHLNLVQEATDPAWSAFDRRYPGALQALRANDEPFLRWQLATFPVQIILCNGKTVFDTVSGFWHCGVVESGTFGLLKWNLTTALLGDRMVCIAGWNWPLARPTGLGARGERALGALLADRLQLRGWQCSPKR